MGTLGKGKTFGATEQVDHSKLHQLVDSGTISDIVQADLSANLGLVTISGSAPSDTDSLWLDTSTTPYTLRYYDSGVGLWIGVSGGEVSACSAYLSSTQAIGNSGVEKVEFDTESFDNLGEYDNATNYRWTATIPGLYVVSTQVKYTQALDADAYAETHIYKNGSAFALNRPCVGSQAVSICVPLTRVMKLVATDYIEVYARQLSAADKNAGSGHDSTFLTIAKVG